MSSVQQKEQRSSLETDGHSLYLNLDGLQKVASYAWLAMPMQQSPEFYVMLPAAVGGSPCLRHCLGPSLSSLAAFCGCAPCPPRPLQHPHALRGAAKPEAGLSIRSESRGDQESLSWTGLPVPLMCLQWWLQFGPVGEGRRELSLESWKNSIKDNCVQQSMIHPFPTHTESWDQPGEQRHLR